MKTLLFTALMTICVAVQLGASVVYEQNLSGQNLQVGTMLTWSTAYEQDNSLFIIEKSEDGANFVNIGTVQAAGNSQELRQYNFLDIMASAERNYYRLKQVDVDGTFSFSDVVAVPQVFTNNFMVARMSNVATQDMFEWTVDSMKDGDMVLTVSNLRGEQVHYDEVMLTAGLNDLAVDLSSHEEGIYKVAMTMDDETETLIVKRVTAEILKKPNVASGKTVTPGRN